MIKRHSIKLVCLHQRVRGSIHPMHVKFFFKQCVYCAVEIERESRRPGSAEFVVHIKTARTIHEQAYLRARQAPARSAIVPVLLSVRFIVRTHGESISRSRLRFFLFLFLRLYKLDAVLETTDALEPILDVPQSGKDTESKKGRKDCNNVHPKQDPSPDPRRNPQSRGGREAL